jgi:hypothetical protein
MKKISLKNTLFIGFLIFSIHLNAQTGAFRVRRMNSTDPAIQIGYDDYRYLSFGKSTSSTNNGAWAIEYAEQGLNFWKPWPTSRWGNYKMHIRDEGHVGINGIANPGYTRVGGFLGMGSRRSDFYLQVYGNAVSHGWWTFSDSSIKENVVQIQNILPQLLKMKPIEYNYKPIKLSAESKDTIKGEDTAYNNSIDTDSKKHYGFTAQEVSRIFPVLEEAYTEKIGVVNYVEFVPLLVRGIQEQQAIIETLKQEIADLKGKTVYTDVDKTKLFQNDPNPFRGTTNFTYFIDENVTVSNAMIEVRNIMGVIQSTVTLDDKSGLGKATFDSNGLADGYYIYTLKINGSVKDSKMLLIGD